MIKLQEGLYIDCWDCGVRLEDGVQLLIHARGFTELSHGGRLRDCCESLINVFVFVSFYSRGECKNGIGVGGSLDFSLDIHIGVFSTCHKSIRPRDTDHLA